MARSDMEEAKKMLCYGCGGLVALFGLVTIITVLASIKSLAHDEQLVIENLDGKVVVNGPQGAQVYNPFRDKYVRKAIRLGNLEYCRVKNMLTGDKTVEIGPTMVWPCAYCEPESTQQKLLLQRDEYVRFVDRLTGAERVETGPQTITPGPWEETEEGVQQASFVNRDSAVIVLNKLDGSKRLVETSGLFFPEAYQVVDREVSLFRVLPHEAMVIRTASGRYDIKSGRDGEGGAGSSFFLGPYDRIVEMEWSAFSEPRDGSSQQDISVDQIERIDLRARKMFFQYEVRTNDNVNLNIQGTLYWRVTDVASMVNTTADPAGDVWHHSRSALIAAVSAVTLDTFMNSFNVLVQAAFNAQAQDGFYQQRGVEVESMEVTKYEPVDEETATTLQEIIQETTDRINRLEAQRSENDVRAARLYADIQLERQRTELITTQAQNERLVAAREGEAQGVELATSASSFLDGLQGSVPDLSSRLDLYRMHNEIAAQNEKTKHIASGKSTLFLTPGDMSLQLNQQNSGSNTAEL